MDKKTFDALDQLIANTKRLIAEGKADIRIYEPLIDQIEGGMTDIEAEVYE